MLALIFLSGLTLTLPSVQVDGTPLEPGPLVALVYLAGTEQVISADLGQPGQRIKVWFATEPGQGYYARVRRQGDTALSPPSETAWRPAYRCGSACHE